MPLARSASVNARVVLPRQLDEAGVEQRRVLALEQADAAEPVRERDRDVGALLAQDRRRLLLARGVQRREDGGDARPSVMPGVADPPGRRAHARARRTGRAGRPSNSWPPSSMTTSPRTSVGQVLRPVDEGRQRGAGGQADAHRGDAAEVAPLHHRVGEVGGADHHRVDVARAGRLLARSAARARVMPVGHVRRWWASSPPPTTASSSRSTASVLVPPTSMPMRRLTRTPSGSRGRSRRRAGPTCSRPFGVSRIGGAGSAMTVTRWP